MNSHRNPRNQRAVGGDAGNPGGHSFIRSPLRGGPCHPKGGAS